ncbi:hypothetical protein P775_00520 [Puniceibacterium antarcticum]|uniref:Uncharacterized protein n=1 Tax=Puniceibacterium antarcticum TaxID=1206336 RepID=A0A2G8RKX3_9RHOB|nr:hypothetical protein [Puniceibacterium antarcticum]PIL22200.1 hypothetical protein P775_00520 [Puniceibacterium antarcticum]
MYGFPYDPSLAAYLAEYENDSSVETSALEWAIVAIYAVAFIVCVTL